jgi:hypothetical protein
MDGGRTSRRTGFPLIEIAVAVVSIGLSAAFVLPLLSGGPHGPPHGRAMEVIRQALSNARLTAMQQQKFVAVHFTDGEVRLFLFPKSDSEPPIGVEDLADSESDGARQDQWTPAPGVRAWALSELVTADEDHAESAVVLVSPGGVVLDGVSISPRGDRNYEGKPRPRERSTTRLRITPRCEADGEGFIVQIDRTTGEAHRLAAPDDPADSPSSNPGQIH